VADDILFMDQGRIVERNAAEDFFLHPSNERTRQFLERVMDYDINVGG
jgi:ABC-type polar amino acid transport system ATPase subunit